MENSINYNARAILEGGIIVYTPYAQRYIATADNKVELMASDIIAYQTFTLLTITHPYGEDIVLERNHSGMVHLTKGKYSLLTYDGTNVVLS